MHFIDISEIDSAILARILEKAVQLKQERNDNTLYKPFANKNLAMIFEKPSTRTRISFEVGMVELGGNVLTLNHYDIQLGRGESVADTARVMSRYVDMVMIRCFKHETLTDFTAYGTIPVINGLSDHSHPCQIMADIMTFQEKKGDIRGKTIAWLGDCNNVTISWIHAAAKFGFELKVACPKSTLPDKEVIEWAEQNNANLKILTDPADALENADCVLTDTWLSMGQEKKLGPKGIKRKIFGLKKYQVNEAAMALAKPDAIFMHCLPAHRGKEVTEAVIDGPKSAVWDEAENRLHVQKAIMLGCLGLL